jgi:hypothetical protein
MQHVAAVRKNFDDCFYGSVAGQLKPVEPPITTWFPRMRSKHARQRSSYGLRDCLALIPL